MPEGVSMIWRREWGGGGVNGGGVRCSHFSLCVCVCVCVLSWTKGHAVTLQLCRFVFCLPFHL